MDMIASGEEIEARVWAIEEVLTYLVAQHYTPTELAGSVESYREAGRRLLEAPEGAVMLPSAHSPKAVLAAAIQNATADLFERARRLNLDARAKREARSHVEDSLAATAPR